MGEIYDNLSKETKALFDVIEWVNSTDYLRVCIQDELTGIWTPLEVTDLAIKEKYGTMQ